VVLSTIGCVPYRLFSGSQGEVKQLFCTYPKVEESMSKENGARLRKYQNRSVGQIAADLRNAKVGRLGPEADELSRPQSSANPLRSPDVLRNAESRINRATLLRVTGATASMPARIATSQLQNQTECDSTEGAEPAEQYPWYQNAQPTGQGRDPIDDQRNAIT
jgi:hypothetical protein